MRCIPIVSHLSTTATPYFVVFATQQRCSKPEEIADSAHTTYILLRSSTWINDPTSHNHYFLFTEICIVIPVSKAVLLLLAMANLLSPFFLLDEHCICRLAGLHLQCLNALIVRMFWVLQTRETIKPHRLLPSRSQRPPLGNHFSVLWLSLLGSSLRSWNINFSVQIS